LDAKDSPSRYYVYFWWLAIAISAVTLIYLLSPILTPFLFAAILAYMFNPLVGWLCARRVPRTLSAILVVTLILCLLVGLIAVLVPLFEKQASILIEQLPIYLEWVRTRLAPWVYTKFGIEIHTDFAYFKNLVGEHMKSAGGIAAKLLPIIQSGGASIVAFFISLSLIPIVLFYFLKDWNSILSRIEEMIPNNFRSRIVGLARDIDRVLSEFLRGQVSVMVIMSIIYSVGLWVTGLDYAFSIGLLAGMLVFIPYVGTIVGMALASFAGLMQFQDFIHLIWIWLVFIVGQSIEGWIVTPRFIGNRIGLHPVAVIFALLAFSQLFGFFGVLLALPASAALLVGLRHLRKYLGESY
jgi:predicted PurR-regulated permease PerM